MSLSFLNFFSRRHSAKGSSTFSEFIRNASSSEKRRVYTRVLKRATERQRALMDSRVKSGR